MAGRPLAGAQKGAHASDLTLLFWDEVGFSLEPSVTRTWARQGQTPLLRTSQSPRRRLHGVGLLAYRPARQQVRALFGLQDQGIESEHVISYLRAARRHLRGSVLLVWDRLSTHTSALTRTYLASQARWLRVERLPAYAPELNPVEQMWSNLEARELANLTPDTLQELAEHTRAGMTRLLSEASLLRSFLYHSGLFPELTPEPPPRPPRRPQRGERGAPDTPSRTPAGPSGQRHPREQPHRPLPRAPT